MFPPADKFPTLARQCARGGRGVLGVCGPVLGAVWVARRVDPPI